MNTRQSELYNAIEPSATALGYRIVQINLREGNRAKTLQILAERISDRGMNIDDCTKLSRQISAVLDVEDIIPGAYQLEVSSPGIDRPLIALADFEEYTGFEAKIETHLPMNGRKRFKGVLMGAQDGVVTLALDGQEVSIAHADIQAAKLVLTDALIKAHQDRYKDAS